MIRDSGRGNGTWKSELTQVPKASATDTMASSGEGQPLMETQARHWVVKNRGIWKGQKLTADPASMKMRCDISLLES